jgi:lysozyme
LKLTSYECSANVWTIGYGTTKINGVAVKQGMKITLDEAEEYLEKDYQVFYNAVCKEVANICNDNQIASLTSFTYNVGVRAFKESTLLRVIKENPNNKEEITKQFLRWVFAGEKRVQGLENRRKAEIELFFS